MQHPSMQNLALQNQALDALSDAALIERLSELTFGDRRNSDEAAWIDAIVYERLARTYDAAPPPC